MTTKGRKIQQIKNVAVHYNPQYREFVVSVQGRPQADYYTNDKQDALDTAKAMARELVH